jgi:hypothetical protein
MSKPIQADSALSLAAQVATNDAMFVAWLLGGSALAVALSLWLAQVIEPFASLGRRSVDSTSLPRATLGMVAVGVCAALLLGYIPGGETLHPWTIASCFGCGLLGLMTVASATSRARTGRELGLGRNTDLPIRATSKQTRRAA